MKRKEVKSRVRTLDKELRKSGDRNFRSLILKILLTRPGRSSLDTTWAGWIRSNSIPQLLSSADSLLVQSYSSASSCYEANQLASLVRKYPWEHPELKPRDAAIGTFRDAEETCRRTNVRFGLFNPHLAWHLEEMRRVMLYVLGAKPDMQRILDGCDFGPGASVGVNGDNTHFAEKLIRHKGSTVSAGAYVYARWAAGCHAQIREFYLTGDKAPFYPVDPSLFTAAFDERAVVCGYNKIAFVLKTARTLRVVATEPTWNTYLQKGVDREMRIRLKRWGIDLSNQAANQYFAFLGSMTWDTSPDPFVTVDLKTASDTVAREPVRAVSPPDWYALWDSLRSHSYRLEGECSRYHKFMSMGNGFCFPLESLLFAAACHACGCGKPGKDFLVYGDDIIVRRSKVAELLWLLEELGFTANRDKTFIEGPFRESCGADFYGGENVRPIIFDDPLDSMSKIIGMHNQIVRNPRWLAWVGDEALQFLKSLIPEDIRLLAPYGSCGDGAFQVEMDEFMASPFARWEADTGTWSWLGLRVRAVADKAWRKHARACVLHRIGVYRGAESRDTFTYRRKTRTSVHREVHGGAKNNWLPNAHHGENSARVI